jgi:hypothetical protein
LIGHFYRHVTAIGSDPSPEFAMDSTALDRMASETALGELGEIALGGMNVMACRTGHLCLLETSASLQEIGLIAMHIDGSFPIWMQLSQDNCPNRSPGR